MPRTSNLFITSPRAGAHPAGKVSCLGFRGGTRALSGSWGGELWGSGERWPVSPHHPSSALLCFSFPRPCCLPAFCFFMFWAATFFYLWIWLKLFHSSQNSLYSIFCGCLYGTAIHTVVPKGSMAKKKQDVTICCQKGCPEVHQSFHTQKHVILAQMVAN